MALEKALELAMAVALEKAVALERAGSRLQPHKLQNTKLPLASTLGSKILKENKKIEPNHFACSLIDWEAYLHMAD